MTLQKRPIQRARRLRRDATTGEQSAWITLRKFRTYGFPVRRQHPIRGLVVDFAIPRAKLVIEVDGGIHNLDVVKEKDEERDRFLAERGWQVVRISNDMAFDPDGLFALIAEKLGI